MAAVAQPQQAGMAPKIKLYTNHQCPYAHRSHITLKELGLAYEEVIIDLEKPREQWYLDEVNPRGLVPSLKILDGALADEIVTESTIVCQFLADMQPSHLAPQSTDPKGPLVRVRMNFFLDTWQTKVASYMISALRADSTEEKEAKCQEWVAAVQKELEPLLKGVNPFFGGSQKMTLVEVNTAPFLMRIYAMVDGGLLPSSLKEGLNALPNFSKWAHATMSQESVTYIWDEEKVLASMKKLIAKIKGKK